MASTGPSRRRRAVLLVLDGTWRFAEELSLRASFKSGYAISPQHVAVGLRDREEVETRWRRVGGVERQQYRRKPNMGR